MNNEQIVKCESENLLQKQLTQNEWVSLKVLKIIGNIGKNDLEFITFLSANFRKLEILDLSHTTISCPFVLQKCVSIKELIMPDNIEAIPDGGLLDCALLTKIKLPAKLKSIGMCAFQGCRSLQGMTLPNSVKEIKESAFRGCLSLKTITLNEGLTSLGNFAFQFCQSIKKITVPSSLTELGKDVFFAMPNLEEINVNPANKSFISIDGVFYALVDNKPDILITYPSANKQEAFLVHDSLRIEANAFFDCFKLQQIIVDNRNQYYTSEEGVLYNKDMTAIIRVPSAFKATKFCIPIGIKEIVPNAFRFCTNIKEIIVPETIQFMEGAFFGCKRLENIKIPVGIQSLRGTFQSCDALTSVEIPDTVINISNAFCGCISLSSVTLPNNIQEMDAAFWGCTNLRNINIPNSVTKIGVKTFCGCEHLEDITLNENITKIEQLAFADTGIKSIKIPPIERLSESAFRDCKKLENVVLSEGTICINREAFLGCTALKNMTLPKSLKRISDGAFVNCNSLEEIIIPSNCENIGNGVFTNCTNIRRIQVLSPMPPVCMPYTFDGVNMQCEVFVQKNAMELYKQAPIWNRFQNIIGTLFDPKSI